MLYLPVLKFSFKEIVMTSLLCLVFVLSRCGISARPSLRSRPGAFRTTLPSLSTSNDVLTTSATRPLNRSRSWVTTCQRSNWNRPTILRKRENPSRSDLGVGDCSIMMISLVDLCSSNSNWLHSSPIIT